MYCTSVAPAARMITSHLRLGALVAGPKRPPHGVRRRWRLGAGSQSESVFHFLFSRTDCASTFAAALDEIGDR